MPMPYLQNAILLTANVSISTEFVPLPFNLNLTTNVFPHFLNLFDGQLSNRQCDITNHTLLSAFLDLIRFRKIFVKVS